MEFQYQTGGITFPKGFSASGIHCGLRKNTERLDIALIVADVDCAVAGVFTQNKVFAAPVGVTKAHVANGKARAIICNSGNANTCNTDGYDKANATCAALAKELNINEDDIIVASTGVIGVPLPLEPILNGIPTLAAKLDKTAEAADCAARAIMTTDTKKKEFALSYQEGDKTVRVAGICKGSGMIEPNMATMLGFITTDLAITPALLQKALSHVVGYTFNSVSVDHDTSTNDMVTVLASGLSGNSLIEDENDPAYGRFVAALRDISTNLAKSIAGDGEGASKLLECRVRNFCCEKCAKILAKSVINSPLVKTAMFGADANWGRILCALGYAGVEFDVELPDVKFISEAGEILVCQNGRGYPFDEDLAKKILTQHDIVIDIDMKAGQESATVWGCDLTYDYVKINGDYRS